jgi:hypothetical protein
MTIYEVLRVNIPITPGSFSEAEVDPAKPYREITFRDLIGLSLELRISIEEIVTLIGYGSWGERYYLIDQPTIRQ